MSLRKENCQLGQCIYYNKLMQDLPGRYLPITAKNNFMI